MKRLIALFCAALMLTALAPAAAQEGETPILLNDATPSIQVDVQLPPDSTGAVGLDFTGAEVRLLDDRGRVVFAARDQRLHGLQLNLAPNSGAHTLIVQRLPGVSEALVRLHSDPDLLWQGQAQTTASQAITLGQQHDLPISHAQPGGSVGVRIPQADTGVLGARFEGLTAAVQLTDSAGQMMAASGAGHIDGLNLLLDGGAYVWTMAGDNATADAAASVRVLHSADAGFSVLEAPLPAAQAAVQTACTATVNLSAVNLRSGPGLDYSVLGYGVYGQAMAVGGRNPGGDWLLVSVTGGSAWVMGTGVQMQGECTALQVFGDGASVQPSGAAGSTSAGREAHESEVEDHGDSEDD